MDLGTKGKKPRSELIKSPEYIDAFDRVRARPKLADLSVKNIELIYSNGRTIAVEMESIHFGPGQRAYIYERKGGVVYPRDQSGNIEFDTTNTPYIVLAALGFKKEIAHRRAQREEIGELVYTFAQIVELGSSAGGPPTAPGGGNIRLPRMGGTRRATGGGSGTPSNISGGSGKPTGGTGTPTTGGGSGTPGGGPGKPTGGTGGGGSGNPTGGGGASSGPGGSGPGKPPAGGGGAATPAGRSVSTIKAELIGAQTILDDAKLRAIELIQEEGIPLNLKAPKPNRPKKIFLPKSEVLTERLNQIGNNHSSPRQAEAKKLVSKIIQLRVTLSNLEVELNQARAGNIN